MHKPKILVIDDQHGINHFYKDLLSDEAFEVTFITDMATVVAALNTHTPDLVVADIERVKENMMFAQTIARKKIIAIWASKFETVDLAALPISPRIINKPFRHVDLRTAIKSEFSKAKIRFDTI